MSTKKQINKLEECYALTNNDFYSIDDLAYEMKKFVNAVIQNRVKLTLVNVTKNGRETIEIVSYEGTATKGGWYYWSLLPIACGFKTASKYSHEVYVKASNSNGRDILKRKIIDTAFKCGSITKNMRDKALAIL